MGRLGKRFGWRTVADHSVVCGVPSGGAALCVCTHKQSLSKLGAARGGAAGATEGSAGVAADPGPAQTDDGIELWWGGSLTGWVYCSVTYITARPAKGRPLRTRPVERDPSVYEQQSYINTLHQ